MFRYPRAEVVQAAVYLVVITLLGVAIYKHVWPEGFLSMHPGIRHRSRVSGDNEEETFTAVVMAVGQIKSLEKVLKRNFEGLKECSVVCILWNDQQWPAPSVDAFNVSQWLKRRMVVLPQPANDLNNRFLAQIPTHSQASEAIFAFDDDVLFKGPSVLRKAFNLWKQNRDTLVGFKQKARGFRSTIGGSISNTTLSGSKKEFNVTYKYVVQGELSLLLTASLFYHRKYHLLYEKEMPEKVKQFIREHTNGEDIALNFLVASRTKGPFLAIDNAYVRDLRRPDRSRLSGRRHHYHQRSLALNEFAKAFGHMPLRPVRLVSI